MTLFARHGAARWNLVRIDHEEMAVLRVQFPGVSYPVCYTLDPFHVWPNPIEGVTYEQLPPVPCSATEGREAPGT